MQSLQEQSSTECRKLGPWPEAARPIPWRPVAEATGPKHLAASACWWGQALEFAVSASNREAVWMRICTSSWLTQQGKSLARACAGRQVRGQSAHTHTHIYKGVNMYTCDVRHSTYSLCRKRRIKPAASCAGSVCSPQTRTIWHVLLIPQPEVPKQGRP